ncbi:interleukin-1 receptor type 1 isoform X5 [Myotis yumanensis]|uniref:interleukin-1 receptor type 1 isoform X5 n=1 Tax=Myotis yumanensis TaxID=159337 RepID=UPI0038D3DB0A
MKVLLRLVCFIALLISSLEAGKCEERTGPIILVSSAYEIAVRSCPLDPNENKGSINWYKNDSNTAISMERGSRIHQYKDKLWFVPAKVEDSGLYYCTVRNSTYCLKIEVTAKFVQHEPDLCYSAQVIYPQKLIIAGNGQLVCPYLDYFKDENNELPKIEWDKDCKPLLLDDANFIGESNKLIIMNVTEAHKGKYTCRASYTLLGKQYRISRVIELLTLEENRPQIPEIVSPVNETMEVVPGSQLLLVCNVTGREANFVYWKWNGSLIDDDDPVLAENYIQVENPPSEKRNTVIVMLNITKVKSKFYLYPFTCVARNKYGINAAYIQLIHPVPSFQKHLIVIFVMLTVVITSSVFIYKIFKVDIVLWYRDSCYDFLPKKDIVEVTNENIKKSRRLIVILVRETSGLSWLGSSSEEHIVLYNALVQDGVKVVLLELEKIQDYEKMPESIQFLKRKQGAIRWSGDWTAERSQSAKTRFWKKVRYHMPAQQPLQPSASCCPQPQGPTPGRDCEGRAPCLSGSR